MSSLPSITVYPAPGIAYKQPQSGSFVTLLSTGATMNNVPAGLQLTSSAVDGSGYLYKAVMGWMASGSATSFGAQNANLYVDISHDNTHWNTNYQSGAFTTIGVWHYQSISTPLAYIRGRLHNPSGSAVSGSITIIGFIP